MADLAPALHARGHLPLPPRQRLPAAGSRLPAPGRPRLRRLPTEVCGLVERPLVARISDLRALAATSQITKHNCIQGWTNIAEWGGVPLAAILDQCRPTPQARYLVFYAYDDKAITENEGRFGHFYGTIPLQLARRPQTILALDMNGAPLPVEHGAPVRLRVETQLGFKMVKWIRSIELVADYARIGMGQGGWREDQQYYANAAGI